MIGWKCLDCGREGEGNWPDFHNGHNVIDVTVRKCPACNTKLRENRSCPGCEAAMKD